jgi:hypothetical protein
MTTERDPGTRIVLSWLREDAHENAEALLLRALDEVDTTPQRGRSWPARRFPRMNAFAKLAIAAAAVVVIAVAGFQLVPRTGMTGSQPTPSPALTASPSATPAPTTPPLGAGPLAPGRYALDWDGPPTTIDVPAGWSGVRFGAEKGTDGAEVNWGGWPGAVAEVFSDACYEGERVPVDGTVQGLVEALDAQLGTDATITEVTLDGRPATRVDLVPSPGLNMALCSEGATGPLKIWHADDPGYYALTPGGSGLVHVLEVDGELVVFVGGAGPGATAGDIAEREAVIASAQFGP